jgi:adenylate cyclase
LNQLMGLNLKNRTDLNTTLIMVAGVFLFSVIIGYMGPVQMMELKVRDWMFELRGERNLDHSDIIIIEMSQTADEEIPYKYPWPTYVYAKLVENLNKAGVKAIGIDVIFDQYDIYDLKNDSLFAETLERYGNVILAGSMAREVRTTDSGVGLQQTRMVMPNQILREVNPNPVGLVNTVSDRDEFIRSYLLYMEGIEDTHYSLGLQMLRFLDHDNTVEKRDTYLKFGSYEIPVFRANTMLINYFGGARSFNYVGFEEVIDDQEFDTVTEMEAFEMNLFDDPEYGILHQGILEDKIVLVGATMPELQDLHPIPVRNEFGSSNMPGVEIHAHAMQNIIDGDHLSLLSDGMQLLILFSISLMIVLAAKSVGMWAGMTMIVGFLFAWIAISILIFIEYGVVMLYLSPSIAILSGFGGVSALNYFHEEREKRRITGMFSSYVSPKLVNRMIESDEAFRLGGEELELTALFSDIANFSTLAEKIPPELLIELINEYLEEMTDIVLEEDGTLDKYIGDAVMAFYGAPAEVKDHGNRACTTAVKMQKMLEKLRIRWRNRNDELPDELLEMKIRIGINTGRMVVGNIGSEKRFSYTILGDQVNIAARCESACKKYGVGIIVTERTVRQINESTPESSLVFRPLDNIRVKGRFKPILIFECVGFDEELSDQSKQCLQYFEEGLTFFQNKDWEEALARFRLSEKYEYSSKEPAADPVNPSQIYIQRCEQLIQQPPGENWDGVFEQTAEY